MSRMGPAKTKGATMKDLLNYITVTVEEGGFFDKLIDLAVKLGFVNETEDDWSATV